MRGHAAVNEAMPSHCYFDIPASRSCRLQRIGNRTFMVASCASDASCLNPAPRPFMRHSPARAIGQPSAQLNVRVDICGKQRVRATGPLPR
jgi:hypothetical protein